MKENSRFISCIAHHREANQVADYMANRALQGDFVWTNWTILDPEYASFIPADGYDVQFPT